jgi:hypothetical protein
MSWPIYFDRYVKPPLYQCVVQNWGVRLLVPRTC